MTISNIEHQILTALISLEKKGLIRAAEDDLSQVLSHLPDENL